MRDLDRLATAAMRDSARLKKRLVERDVVGRHLDRARRNRRNASARSPTARGPGR